MKSPEARAIRKPQLRQLNQAVWQSPDKLADMNDDAAPTRVYFTCPRCLLPYRTTQVRRREPVSGKIDCLQCGGPVHRWAGFYDFIGWRPVGPDASDKGKRGRRH
jgi:hypothetical protein